MKAVTTEHQLLTVKCGCGCETKAQAPDGVSAPVQYGPRIMGTGIYLWHGQFLSRDRACQAPFRDVRLRALARRARRRRAEDRRVPRARAGRDHPAPDRLRGRPLRRDRVPHRGQARLGPFRVGGEVRPVHRARQARQGRDEGRRGPAALRRHRRPRRLGTLRHLRATSQGHALCGAHVLRELVAVTETGTDLDKAWAQQAIDALLALNEAAEAARAAGRDAIDPETRDKHEDWYRKAAETGIALNAARQGKLQQKRTPSPRG